MQGIYKIKKSSVLTFLGLVLSGGGAFADVPRDWQMNFQEAATPVMEKVAELHHLLLTIEAFIALFVVSLITYTLLRFRASRNKVPSKTSHNTMIEVIWTAIPVLILVVIAVPSLKLIYYMDKAPNAQVTVKAIGSQWYWTYEYPDHGIKFDSMLVEDKDLQPDHIRLLEVDNRVVVPVNTDVRLITTSMDVLHSWAIPAFGVKKDSVPGRLNETWFNVSKEGVYRGQCSELCGSKHGFMPIVVEVVSKARYDQWVAAKKPVAPPAPAPAPAGEAKPATSAPASSSVAPAGTVPTSTVAPTTATTPAAPAPAGEAKPVTSAPASSSVAPAGAVPTSTVAPATTATPATPATTPSTSAEGTVQPMTAPAAPATQSKGN